MNYKRRFLVYSCLISAAIHLVMILVAFCTRLSLVVPEPEVFPKSVPIKLTERLPGIQESSVPTGSMKKNDVLQHLQFTVPPAMLDQPVTEQDEQVVVKRSLQPQYEHSLPSQVATWAAIELIESQKKGATLVRPVTARPTESMEPMTTLSDHPFYPQTITEHENDPVQEKTLVEKLPGVTSSFTQQPQGTMSAGGDLPVGPGNIMKVVEKPPETQAMENQLQYHLSTYHDPHSAEKYFQLTIQVNAPATRLPTIPKEIVFLVDCSLSIDSARLEQFKEGIRYCLTHLNPGDRFNILAFKEKVIKFQTQSIELTPAALKQALQFVDNLRIGEKTDTYQALYDTLQQEGSLHPTYVVLMSDGRPTKGVTNSRELINAITKFNQGKIAVFAFSGGMLVNRYLLDFIAYKNRGWAEYADRTHVIGERLSEMYQKIRDPIMLRLRYYVNGIQQDEVVPKILPDFFRHTEFALYGKYTSEAQFFIQFIGDTQSATKDYFVRGDFTLADQGGEDIARNWAFNRIYHLIGLLEDDRNNQTILNEIRTLTKRFNIQTPYEKELQE
jgi:uncharacterized protein YegL